LDLNALLQNRLLLVTGKGGTGKTTFAAALATLAAASGRRTVLAEVDAQWSAMDAIFDAEVGFEPVEVRENLRVCNIRWEAALEAYLRGVVPMKRVVRLVLENAIVNRFLDFTPGSRELVMMSIIGNLVEENDLVVVDMPASGHAFALLDILRSAMGLFRSGPIRARTEQLVTLIRDKSTRMVLVGLPEEMVVNETLETFERMKEAGQLSGPPAVFINRSTMPSLSDDERELLRRLSEADLSPNQREFVAAGRWEDALEQATARAQQRLTEALPEPPVLVPPAGSGGIPREVVGSVVVNLGRRIGLTRRDIQWT
jgi:anion-transporting  ArsA/GET3 family ATPase